MLPKIYPSSIDWLDRRLMSAINRNSLRDVKAFLALGACPNRPSSCEKDWPAVPNSRTLSVTLPLARTIAISNPESDYLIEKALLAAGADVALCLYWLSRTASPDLNQIVDGLILCEMIHKLPGRPVYNQTVKTWLKIVSTKLNKLPEPADMDRREYHVLVHKRLLKVSNDFGRQHKPVGWVTAELL